MAKKPKAFRRGATVTLDSPDDKEPIKRTSTKPRSYSRPLETASSGSNLPVKPSSVKVDTASGNNIIKRPTSEVAIRAGKDAGDIGKGVSRAAKLAGRAFPILTGALEPSELSGDETPYKGVKDSYTATSARDRAADILGQPRSKVATSEPSKAETSAPSTPAKKIEPVVAVKKTQTVAMSKPKGSSEGARARAALQEFKDWNASREPLDTSAEDMNTQGKLDAAEDSEYKRGGQIKRRPPKPAKKVPAKRFASGGMSRSSASKRGDGCATKGHTKGRVL